MSTTPREILPFRETTVTPAVPKFVAVNPDSIPEAMKALPRWVYWRGEVKDGKPTKVPYRIGSSQHASSTDPATWGTFADALAGTASGNGSFPYNGLGFAFEGSGIVFVDFDHVRNPETGEILPWATVALANLNSYTEVSPSGDGLHVYALGKLPCRGAQRRFSDGSALEIYDAGRYATVTGQRLTDFPQDVRPCDLHPVLALLQLAKTGAVLALLQRFGLTITSTEDPFQGQTEIGVKYLLDACPFNSDHRDAAVFDYPSGPVFSCFHNSCTGHDWRALCDKYQEPWGLIRDLKGKPKAVLSNAVLMLRDSQEWQGVAAYDEFSLKVIVRNSPPWPEPGPSGREWSDDDDRRTACWLQQHHVMVNTNVAAEAIQTVARENSFHPIKDYLESQVWDQTERIAAWLCVYFGAEDSAYTRAVASRWLISGVARLYDPGCQADCLLVLLGPQGILKSSAVRTLAIRDSWFSECVADLSGSGKDARGDLAGKWLVELSELSAMRRAEVERVKAFLSCRVDHYRPPYGRRSVDIPRMNIFCGTTNDQNPFLDASGNRRFWPISCGRIDLDGLKRDRDQLWAEALVRFRAGSPWWLETPELNEAAAQAQDERYLPGIWDEQILNFCDHPEPRAKRADELGSGDVTWELPFDSSRDAVTIYDVLVHGLGKTLDKFTQADVLQVSNCLKHHGWTKVPQSRVKGSDRRVRLYLRPGVTL